ncbi:MAG: sugar transferase [Kofleriaceae bacterium]|nr:sugar transferase [Kofleriaceae bacterium]
MREYVGVGRAPELRVTPLHWIAPRRRPLVAVTSEIREIARGRGARWTKRGIDIIGSLIVLALVAPLFVVVMLAVRLSGPGPVFFVQERCGLSGRLFRFYKFRTMVVDAEARKPALWHLNEVTGAAFKIVRDPRITRVGSLLRKLSLDELPQLWNVLRGDMSLVGPRPPTPDEVEQYSRHQVQRLAVIPGISGLWQVSGRSSIADFDQWIELDLHYVRTWSVWLDLAIILRTPIAVIWMRGAA